MHTVTTRIYDVDSAGRRFLLHRPGDVIDDREAKRVATLVDDKPGKPGWMRIMERRKEDLYDETPTKPLGNMTLKDLRAVCAAEEIDPGGAITRAEHRKKIEAGREQRRSTPNER